MQLQTAIAASLLDEATFMTELKSLEVGLKSIRKTPGPIDHDVDDDEPVGRTIDGVGEEFVRGPSLLWRVTAAAMFVLMMGVGAAGAAAVFHQRVARIVAVWQQQ